MQHPEGTANKGCDGSSIPATARGTVRSCPGAIRKDLWRSSGPTHVLEQGYLEQVAQAHVWMALEADYTTTLFCKSIPQTC